ncbi:MAG TPA: GNAT family N-acetyltransferase, partial [Rhabdochlamydiaceae bacterium]
ISTEGLTMSTIAAADLDTAVCAFFQEGSPITIETKDLTLRSIQENDLDFMQNLYTDPITMRLYTDNEKRLENSGADAWKEEQMKAAKGRVDTFVKRWTADRIPFSGFLISTKNDPRPIGFIVPGFGDNPGQLETAFAIKADEQGKGFGSQAVHAIVQQYIPALIANHYKIYGKPLLVDNKDNTIKAGDPVTEMVATARLDNGRSIRVQEKAGMNKIGENPNKWGQVRGIYIVKYENPPVKV